ncbi:polysaccharide lyase family 7 protein [Aquimarina pacifica]|uniref:polysaccharide lyase family 7 protein n=1 Tax=Aquimarina pacifica TaxID=1296415 RepID=UPI0004711CDD|nr:polysaccharide lyase family 7 protein [Aquimarina pacifica]
MKIAKLKKGFFLFPKFSKIIQIYFLLLAAIFLYNCSNEEFSEDDILQAKVSPQSEQLAISNVSASVVQNPNIPENVLEDGDTRWSGKGTSVDFIIDLSTTALIDYIKIAFYKGDTRTASFEIWTRTSSSDEWIHINSKTSSGSTTDLETFDLTNTSAKFVKLVCKGNSSNSWNSINLLEVWGTPEEDDNGGSNNGYEYPYEIPKFKDAISKSKLQAPTSSTAATASQLEAGYTSNWFYVADNDKMAFYQTGSSKRTELRFENNWYAHNSNRNAHANLKIISQTGDQTTFLQIHDDANAGNGPNKPLLRMYRSISKGDGNHIWAAIKTDDGGSTTTHVDCGEMPSGYFDCDVSISQGSMTIKINGATKTTKNISFWDFPSYWKAGVYNQNDGGTTIYFNELEWY